MGFSQAQLNLVKDKIRKSQYKRTMPPIAKLQPRSAGIDFRYNRDWDK
jgi:hypothetical protein